MMILVGPVVAVGRGVTVTVGNWIAVAEGTDSVCVVPVLSLHAESNRIIAAVTVEIRIFIKYQ